MTNPSTSRAMRKAAGRNGIGAAVPSLIAAAGEQASVHFREFFAGNIRNRHTRRAYYQAADGFLEWCTETGVRSIVDVKPEHVAAWIEASASRLTTSSIKQRVAAVRTLFDWLVSGNVLPVNPARQSADTEWPSSGSGV